MFNYLSLLVSATRKLLAGAEKPVAYIHRTHNGEVWQVIVTRLPDAAYAVAA
jgi:hypothetical protein